MPIESLRVRGGVWHVGRTPPPTMMRWSFDARSGKDSRRTLGENREDDE
jgi:hypothetical protein